MRTLPHVVIGCATVWAASRLVQRQAQGSAQQPDFLVPRLAAQLSALTEKTAIDYRQIAVGSMLPDLIDRALRRFVVRGPLQLNDHILGHTILANVPAFVLGLALVRRGDPRLLAVSVAAFTHLAVDPIAREPRTLLWPLFGWEFPTVQGLGRPLTYASQVAAAAIGGTALYHLRKTRRLRSFFLAGRL